MNIKINCLTVQYNIYQPISLGCILYNTYEKVIIKAGLLVVVRSLQNGKELQLFSGA